MIEITLYDFLTQKLSVPVYMDIPQNPPVKKVVIEKTGSSGNYIKTSTFAVQSYGASLLDAMELNEYVKEIIFDGLTGLISIDDILRVELNSDYNFTDTTTKKYRYQSVINITHY